MEFNFKRTLAVAYIIAGFVWSILTLPNLMSKAKGSAVLATGLAIIRILCWPIFALLLARSGKDTESTEGDANGEATTTAD